MTSKTHPRIVELTEQQCRQRIEQHEPSVGRIGFAESGDPDWPTVLPINYVYVDGAIYVRTFEGSKLYAALRRQRVAFEIDVADEQWTEGWSVVAVGSLELVDGADTLAAIDAALEPWPPGTRHLLRMDIEQLTGRRIIGRAPE